MCIIRFSYFCIPFLYNNLYIRLSAIIKAEPRIYYIRMTIQSMESKRQWCIGLLSRSRDAAFSSIAVSSRCHWVFVFWICFGVAGSHIFACAIACRILSFPFFRPRPDVLILCVCVCHTVESNTVLAFSTNLND